MVVDEREFPPLPSQGRIKVPRHLSRNQAKKASSASLASSRRIQTGVNAAINDLPDELILEILSYLPCLDPENFQLPAIRALSLANRRLHNMVVGKLYASYDSLFCLPYLFLRTLVSNPQLGEHVRTVNLSSGCESQSACGRQYVPTTADRKAMKQGLKSFSVPDWKAWTPFWNAKIPNQEFLYAAILMHTPNITSLAIRHSRDYGHPTPKWLDLIKWAANSQPYGRMHRFSHLHAISVKGGTLSLNQLAPLFRLKSLRKLEMTILEELSEFSSLQRLIPPGSSQVEKLLLPDSSVDAQVTSILLEACHRLRHLNYPFCLARQLYKDSKECSSWVGGNWKDASKHPCLLDALDRNRNTLERLELYDEHEQEVTDDDSSVILHGILLNFRSLSCLKAPFGAFIDTQLAKPHDHTALVKALPPLLERLYLIVEGTNIELRSMVAMEHMATHFQSYAPCLNQVTIEAKVTPSEFDYDWERLKKPLFDRKVDFVLDQCPDDSWDYDDSWVSSNAPYILRNKVRTRHDFSEDTESSDEVDLYSSDGE